MPVLLKVAPYFREEGHIKQIDYSEKIKKYTFAPPFTKESLLYREIFDKYYPNQESMIKGYWMPNKEWVNCDVLDPSARVLANYGDSAK